MIALTSVKCTVSDCYYWGRGDLCEADGIEVNVTHATANRGSHEMTNVTNDHSAGASNKTQCTTYRSR